MIPKNLTDKHFRMAATEIDRNSVPSERNSVHYDLVIGGKKYPPKYIISIAARFATGKEYLAAEFNAVEAKNYFLSKGYEVIDRRALAEKAIVAEDDESAFPEGRERFRLHRCLERDSKISKNAKAKRLAETGKLQCDACQLDLVQKYGALGEGFIEAHHTIPVSALDGKTNTKISDLALVCPNCHRMLHRGKLLTVGELSKLVQNHSRI